MCSLLTADKQPLCSELGKPLPLKQMLAYLCRLDLSQTSYKNLKNLRLFYIYQLLFVCSVFSVFIGHFSCYSALENYLENKMFCNGTRNRRSLDNKQVLGQARSDRNGFLIFELVVKSRI